MERLCGDVRENLCFVLLICKHLLIFIYCYVIIIKYDT